MNELKKLVKYPNFCAAVEPILLVLLSLYLMQSGFIYLHYLLSKQKHFE